MRPARALIDLQALRHNYRLAREATGARALAVIKADAYGHGAVRCAEALAAEADGFAVACIEEGLEAARGRYPPADPAAGGLLRGVEQADRRPRLLVRGALRLAIGGDRTRQPGPPAERLAEDGFGHAPCRLLPRGLPRRPRAPAGQRQGGEYRDDESLLPRRRTGLPAHRGTGSPPSRPRARAWKARSACAIRQPCSAGRRCPAIGYVRASCSTEPRRSSAHIRWPTACAR